MLPNFFPIQGNTISNRDILCCNLYNDTLYSINKDGINKKMLIHFPNKIKRDKILTELNNDFSRSKLDYVVHELSILLNSAEITRGLNYYYENEFYIDNFRSGAILPPITVEILDEEREEDNEEEEEEERGEEEEEEEI